MCKKIFTIKNVIHICALAAVPFFSISSCSRGDESTKDESSNNIESLITEIKTKVEKLEQDVTRVEKDSNLYLKYIAANTSSMSKIKYKDVDPKFVQDVIKPSLLSCLSGVKVANKIGCSSDEEVKACILEAILGVANINKNVRISQLFIIANGLDTANFDVVNSVGTIDISTKGGLTSKGNSPGDPCAVNEKNYSVHNKILYWCGVSSITGDNNGELYKIIDEKSVDEESPIIVRNT